MPEPPKDWPARAAAHHAAGVTGFPVVEGLPDRMAPGEGRLAVGDELVYGLELHRGDRTQRWLLHFEVQQGEQIQLTTDRGVMVAMRATPTFSISFTPDDGEPQTLKSETRPVAVRVFDERGKPLGGTEETAPVEFLESGLVAAAEVRDDPESPKLRKAYATLVSVLRIAENNEVLADVLWQVFDKPSLWSILWSGGVSLGLSLDYHRAELVGETTGVWDIPVRFDLNDDPVMVCSVRAEAPRGALGLGAGMISVAGFRPGDESVWFRLVSLAARRAEGGEE